MTDVDMYIEAVREISEGFPPACTEETIKSSHLFYDEFFPLFSKFMNTSVFCESTVKEAADGVKNIAQKISEQVREEAKEIFLRKNQRRGGAWRDVGAVGACIEIHAKLARLKNLAFGWDKDSCVDLFNYLVIFHMCLKYDRIRVNYGVKQNVVITGDNGSLGRVLKRTFILNGFTVIDYGTRKTKEDIVEFFRSIKGLNIDVLVNNYGVNKLNWLGSLEDEDLLVIDQNLKLPIQVVDQLIRNSHERTTIINVCSQTYKVAQRCTAVYCSTKAALAHLTKVMARELAPKGYVVNAISPGKIQDTRMSELTDKQVLALRGWEEKEADRYAKSLIPMGRFTTTEEVSVAIVAMLSLPPYVNGTVVDMTGGV